MKPHFNSLDLDFSSGSSPNCRRLIDTSRLNTSDSVFNKDPCIILGEISEDIEKVPHLAMLKKVETRILDPPPVLNLHHTL